MHRICRHLILRLSTALGVLSSSEVDEFRAAWVPDKVLVVKNVLRSEFLRAEVKDHHRPVVFSLPASSLRRAGTTYSRPPQKSPGYGRMSGLCSSAMARFAAFRARVAERGLQAQVVHFPQSDQLIDLYSEGGIFVFPAADRLRH